MQPSFRAFVNRTEECRITCAQDIDALCSRIAGLSVFTVHVNLERVEQGATLDIIVESGRALVNFLDTGRGINLCSRDDTCAQRGVVSLRNDAYPELELEQIEVHRRDLISPARAIAILRHYLTSGAAIDLVHWPPDDWDEWVDSEAMPDPPGEDIPF